MKKRILILTFADHVTDEQAKIITETHRQATGLYSGAVLKSTYAPSTEHEISLKTVCESYHGLMKEIENMKPRDFVTGEPVYQSEPDAVAEMAKHFEPDVWAKIVKNYDPTFAVKFGRDLKTACEKESKPSEFLRVAFSWNKSPEKAIYWGGIHGTLKEKGL